MSDYAGKVVLVTGAAGDIGAAAAAAFAARGARVVLTDRRADALNAAAEGARDALALACDQTDAEAVAALFRSVEAQCGRLDAAFINAGYGRYGALIDMPLEQWKRHIDINLTGGFLMAQGAARLIAQGGEGGALVFNASTAAAHVCDMLGAYAAAKAGVRMLARTLASELGPQRIRVNLIMPGVIETAMTQSLLAEDGVRADVLAETPVGRLGAPADIAELAAFLCSSKAGYINGAEILIDGGQTIHGYPRWFSADYAEPDAAWAQQASRRAPPKD